MATHVQSSKGQWIGISTAEETGAKFADGKGKCSWSAMLRCRQKFTKRLVGQPWRDFVKGESDFVKGIDTETEHSKQSFGRLYRALFKGDVRAQSTSHYKTHRRATVGEGDREEHEEYIKFTEGGVMAAQTRLASIHEEIVEWAEENFDPESKLTKIIKEMERNGKSPGDILARLDEAISTAMTKINKRIVKTVSNLIGKYQVIPKGGATINPIDHSATDFEALHRAFQPGQTKIEDLITHLNSMCNLLLEFTDKDTTGQADTSYAARIEFIEHELELCGSDFKKPMDLYEKKEWSEDEGDEEKYTYLCTTLEDHEQNLIERKAELIDREKRDGSSQPSETGAPTVDPSTNTTQAYPALGAESGAATAKLEAEVSARGISDCSYGEDCKFKDTCKWAHRDAYGNLENNPIEVRANLKESRSRNSKGKGKGGKGKGKGKGGRGRGRGRGNYTGRGGGRKRDGEDNDNNHQDKKKVKFSEKDMHEHAKKEVEKYGGAVSALNDGVALPAYQKGSIALPAVALQTAEGESPFEGGKFIGADTCANVSISNTRDGMYDIRKTDGHDVSGIGTKTFDWIGKREVQMRRADGTTAIIIIQQYLDEGGDANIVAIKELKRNGLKLKVDFAEEQTKFKQPKGASKDALLCADGVPIWLHDRNGLVCIKDQSMYNGVNIDYTKVNQDYISGKNLVLLVNAKQARARRIEEEARATLMAKARPMSELQELIVALKERDSDTDDPAELHVYASVHQEPTVVKLTPDFCAKRTKDRERILEMVTRPPTTNGREERIFQHALATWRGTHHRPNNNALRH